MAADFWEAELWKAQEQVRIAQSKLDELSQQSMQQDQVQPQSQPTDNPKAALVPLVGSCSDQLALALRGNQQATDIHVSPASVSRGECYSYYLFTGQQTGPVHSSCIAGCASKNQAVQCTLP